MIFPIVTVSETGEILYLNDRAKSLFGGGSFVGEKFTDFVEVTLPDVLRGKYSDVESAAKTCSDAFVTLVARRSGENFVIYLNDVTDIYARLQSLKAYKKNSNNASKNKNLFLAQIANLLKSPIHSTLGYARAVVEGMTGFVDEKQIKYFNIISKNSSELFGLIDKITELSAIESDLTAFSPKTFDINNLLSIIAGEFEGKIEAKKLSLVINTDDLIKKVICFDDEVLHRILDNLIDNAVMSCEFGNIFLKVSDAEFITKNENYLRLTVTDSGTGIKEEDIPEVFNPYYSPDKKNKQTLIKSLCLACAKNLTEKFGGKIFVLDEGKSFSVVIPVEKKQD